MVTEKDIHSLADLARIQLEEGEAKQLTADIEAILEYVSDIQTADSNVAPRSDVFTQKNVLREDSGAYAPDTFTTDLLNEAHEVDGRSIVVKKILS